MLLILFLFLPVFAQPVKYVCAEDVNTLSYEEEFVFKVWVNKVIFKFFQQLVEFAKMLTFSAKHLSKLQ